MHLVIALACAAVLSFAIEALAGGQRHPVSLRSGDVALRLLAYALVAAFWFVFSWRPWLAATSCVLTVAILQVVSGLKRRVIGEPLVFSDFALLRQVPRHPELYYTRPLTDPRMALPLVASLMVIALWYGLEPAALPHEPSVAVLAVIALPLTLWALATTAGHGVLGRRLASRFAAPDLDADVARIGLPAVVLAYALRWRSGLQDVTGAPATSPRGVPSGDRVVVVVQLESFVDPVRLGGPPLRLMDVIRTRATQYGRLRVPAHGAYTMRTEHAVLTGRDAEDLGFGQFDPYLTHGGEEPGSLPRRAREAGFETVFVHPFHRDFFNRGAVVTRLGFDRLVMEEDFGTAPRVGPYIGDIALAERLLDEVRARSGPLFLFCVTMENHGPWKPGRLSGIDDPCAQYFHHVAHTGEAVERLIAALDDLPATLCVFGDHAPALPNCRPGFGGTSTDYAIFDFGSPAQPQPVDLTADALGRVLRSALRPSGTVTQA